MKLMYETAECDVEFSQELNESTNSKSYKIKGIFSSPGVKNKNGRTYPMNLWEKEVKKYQKVIKEGHPNSLMQLGHPNYTNVKMMEAVAKIDKLYIENGYVMGEATLLNNERANQLKSLIDAGIKMSVSTRGLGSVVENVVTDYKLITVDIIEDLGQSDINAQMMGITEGILTESNFEVDEFDNINEVKVCTENGCNLFEAGDIQKATKDKFKEFMASISEKTGDAKLLQDLKKEFSKVESVDSNAKKIVLLLNNMDHEEAKKIKLDTDKEAKIWSKVAELISTSRIGRI